MPICSAIWRWRSPGFHRAMQAIGMGENVTAFTMSDFGRTFKGNAQTGTDHAWGSNHLVIGGNVTPGGVFGAVPDADMPYVFPNWTTWSTAGRGPIGLFRA